MPIVAIGFAAMMGFYLVPTQLGFLLQSKALGGSADTGPAISCSTAASAAVSLSYPRIRKSLSALGAIFITFVALAGGLTLAASANSLAMVFAAMAAVGLGTGLLQPTLSSLLLLAAPEAVRGRASSLLSASLFGGQFCSALAGLSLGNPPPAQVYLVTAAVMACFAIAIVSFGKRSIIRLEAAA